MNLLHCTDGIDQLGDQRQHYHGIIAVKIAFGQSFGVEPDYAYTGIVKALRHPLQAAFRDLSQGVGIETKPLDDQASSEQSVTGAELQNIAAMEMGWKVF